MSKQAQAAQGSTATAQATITFKQMNLWQKCVHIGKVAVFIITFGFAFPNILSND